MENQNKLAVRNMPPCSAPALNDLLTAYCFGRATPSERLRVEAHLPTCEACRTEAQRLTAAVTVIDTDTRLREFVQPAEVAATFGISGQLTERFGGHQVHCLWLAGIYGLLGALCIILEIAYEFDRFAKRGIPFAILAGVWLFGSAYLAFWCDWRLTERGRPHGLKISFLVFTLGAAACATAAAYLVFPARSITKLSDTAMPAQLAYTGGLIYHLLVIFIFCLPTYHLILAMQREMLSGRHVSVFGLLTNNRKVPPPRGLFFPRLSFLIFMASVFLLWRGSAYFSLVAKLQPSPYHLLFSVIAQVRLLFYLILIAKGIHWYSNLLDEVKRECFLAQHLAPESLT